MPCTLTHRLSGLQEGVRAHQPVQGLQLLAAASAAGAAALLPRREAAAGRRQQQAAHRAAHVHAVVICRSATSAEQRACAHALLAPPACTAVWVLGTGAWPHPARCRPASQNACAARPVRNSRLCPTCKRSKYPGLGRRQTLQGVRFQTISGVLVFGLLPSSLTLLTRRSSATSRATDYRSRLAGEARVVPCWPECPGSTSSSQQSLRTDFCSSICAYQRQTCTAVRCLVAQRAPTRYAATLSTAGTTLCRVATTNVFPAGATPCDGPVSRQLATPVPSDLLFRRSSSRGSDGCTRGRAWALCWLERSRRVVQLLRQQLTSN